MKYNKLIIILVINIFILYLIFSSDIVYCADINLFEYPKLNYQNGSFTDFNYFINLDYFSICDENNLIINNRNIIENLDANSISIYLDDLNYDVLGYSIKDIIDYNSTDFLDVYFDSNNSYLRLNNSKILNLDFNILNYYLYNNYYFFIKENNSVDIYEYIKTDNIFNFLSSIDSNCSIYNMEVFDYNNSEYLFLSNASNGISIYNITDENIFDSNNHYLGSVSFNYNTNDYNTTYLKSFSTQNNIDYILSVVNKSFESRVVFYEIEKLLDLNSFVFPESHDVLTDNYKPQNILFLEDQNKFVISFYETEKTGSVKYILNPNLTIINIGTKNEYSGQAKILNNRVFAISWDGNKLISYNENDFPSIFSLLDSFDFGRYIYDFDMDVDLNRFYVYSFTGVSVIDYNFLSDSFSKDYDLNFIDSRMLFFNNYKSINLLDFNNDLYADSGDQVGLVSEDKFIIYSLILDYNLNYFIPYPTVNDYNISINYVDHDLYYSADFNGDINFTFDIFDYNNFKIGSDYDVFNFNLDLIGSSYNIFNDSALDLDSCDFLNNRTRRCSYIFNIKTLNEIYSLKNKTYSLDLNIIDLNILISNNFIFNIYKSSGSSNNSGSKSSSDSSGIRPIFDENDSDFDFNDLKNNLFLLKDDYFKIKSLFSGYLLDDLLLDINFSFDENNIDIIYESVINSYNNLNKLQVVSSYVVPNNINFSEKYNVYYYPKKKVSVIEVLDSNDLLVGKYYFVELDFHDDFVDDNSFELYFIDSIVDCKSITFSKDLMCKDFNVFGYSLIKPKTDVNYVVDYFSKDFNINDSSYVLKPMVIDSNIKMFDSNLANFKSLSTKGHYFGFNNILYNWITIGLFIILFGISYFYYFKK